MKKRIIIFGLLLFLSINVSASLYGDINNDNVVNSADYILIRKYILGVYNLNNSQKISADMNSDNVINSMDYILIRKSIMNGETRVIPTPTPVPTVVPTPIPTPTEKKITVTFHVNDNVAGKSVKATGFALSYVDSSGVTRITEEGSTLKMTCIDTGNGCKLEILPIIYADGYMVHGWSKEIGGKNINLRKTVFKEDTTVYARVGYYNTPGVGKINTGTKKLYGNVMFEAENILNGVYVNNVVNALDQIYRYYPEIFLFNGKIFFLTSNTYINVLSSAYKNVRSTAGQNLGGTNYSNVYFRKENNVDTYVKTMMHEMGHAFECSSGVQCIVDRDDFKTLYNKYKNMSNRPLRDYSYTKPEEFFADMFCGAVNDLIYQKTGKYLHTTFRNIPKDLTDFIIKVLDEKRTAMKNIGLLR